MGEGVHSLEQHLDFERRANDENEVGCRMDEYFRLSEPQGGLVTSLGGLGV